MSTFPHSWQPWIIPVLAIVGTFVGWKVTQLICLSLPRKGPLLTLLHDLSSAISRFVWVVGLRMAIDAAPLHKGVVLWLDHALYLLVVILFLSFAKKATFIGIDWVMGRPGSSPVLQTGFVPILRNLITLFIFLSGAIMVLKHFDYDVMSLVTALGVGSFAVGLASKETLANMISGFTLVIDRNLKIGDYVNLGGVTGVVDEIGLRSTRVRTGDGNSLIVPNSELVNTRILNLSSPSNEVACSTQLRLPVDVPLEKIRTLCATAMDSVPQIQKNRARSVQLTSLSDGHQLISVVFWVESPVDQGPALSEFLSRILQILRSEHISLISPRPAP